MKNIFFTRYCNHDRIIAIGEIEKIIHVYGYLTDFKQFSDISISLMIELEELKIDNLCKALKSYIELKEFDKLNSSSKKEHTVFLNISFTQGTGDLRIETPAVPG